MNTSARNIWVTVLFVVLIASVAAVFVSGNRRDEPGDALVYDVETLAEFNKTDPSLIKFEQTARIPSGLTDVKAMAVGNDDKIYLGGRDALAVLDPAGVELVRANIDGTPECVAVTPDNEILVGMRDRVIALGSDLSETTEWRDFDEKTYITSIVADDNEVFVADAGNRIVLRFDRTGKLLGRIGEKDLDKDVPGFIVPSPNFDMDFDDEGNLWVVNPGMHGLEQYRSNGDLVTSWYRPSMDVSGFCGCCNPMHIAFRADGSVVTGEKGLARIKVYDATGAFDGLVAPPDLFPDSAAGLTLCSDGCPIEDIAVDERDRVLVLDPRDNSVLVFEEKKSV